MNEVVPDERIDDRGELKTSAWTSLQHSCADGQKLI